MGAYKQFLASDIIATPFEVSKGFTFYVTESIIETTILNPPLPPIDDVPYTVSFFVEYPGQDIEYPGVGVDRLLGRNITDYVFNSKTDPTTGLYLTPLPNENVYPYGLPTGSQYERLVYNSIKQLYYSNYSESVYNDPVNRPILYPGRDEAGNRFVGAINSPRYDNYLQTDLS